ncbi:MAG: Eco57I restriction-modification methylase domain-containing protein [Bacteroidetes bacterium]|nr:Eco57I restriction-modification methylase domain-containing protein [Bacteroidota bacterium]
MTLKELIENKSTLDYQQICTSLIQTFRVDEKVNWESVLPAQQQQEYFGGESLRLIAEHPILSKQKDIRPIALKKGSISQMLFFYVCLNDSSLPKKQIQDVTKKFISGGDANRYIIWFFGNKEKTQLKVVLSSKEGKKVVLKTLPFGIDQPYYKTYNFILNEVNQKVNQLFVEPTDLWKALWNAFDISIINRNFYDEIKGAFTDLLQQLNKKGTPFNNEEDKVQFAIRLIGRIIFCWFLKRKEVLHDAAISSEAVKAHSQNNYYHDLLEPLFFDVLNTPDKERKGGLPKIIAHYPFLNGGLFEAQETDYKQHLLLNIDNDWFHNLFSKTLERYNFTVDENSSSNAEIAIDPEMLGRIFENLLAEQNPETGDSARKATGSFYTPREIVDYMVEQSVAEFLKTALALDEKINAEIEDFVHTQVLPDALAKHEEKISEELSKIKVLDPACGSGAFPIGILQKIVALKQQLHPKAKNYKLKLDTIQNSIYGVDIQPMAVELSRLRCWLSLVVDEDPKDIKALPNLDFKFVCADSLVEVPLITGYTTDALEKSLAALEENVEQYFSPDYKNKKNIKRNIETSLAGISKFYHTIIASFITKIRQEEKTASPTRLKQLKETMMNYFQMDAKWNSYENIFKNKKVEFFNPNFFFPSAKNGFDIVIGNPPYIGANAQDTEHRELLGNSTNYTTLYQKWDIYVAFIERGIRLSKKELTCMIIPYPITNQTYAKKLREFIHTENDLVEITNLSGHKIFDEATVTNCILFVKNGESENQKIRVSKLNDNSISVVDSVLKTDLVRDEKTFVWDLSNKKSLLFSGEGFINLGDYCFISKGMVLNADEVQSKGLFVKSDLVSETKTKTNCKDYTEAKFIEKYKINKIFFLEWGTKRVPDLISRPTFPELYERPKIMVTKIGKIKATVDYTNIYCDQTIRVLVLWNDLKGVKNKSIDNSVKRYQTNSRKVLEEISSQVSLKYLLAIINSKLADTLLDQIRGKGNIDINPEYLKNIPIAKVSIEKQKVFEAIIDFILFLKENETPFHQSISNNLLVKQFEEIIDGMVLELYFGEEMKTKKVSVVELVEKELEKAKGKETTESIYSFYKSVSHPDSEIRNRILSFAIVSPEILKPILQG